MSDRLFACTRKGLFELRRGSGGWAVSATHFLGSPVSMMLHDARDAAFYAALDLGHFGSKLHRSDDGGSSWTEIAAPSFAGIDADAADPPTLKLIWTLEPGGADQPGRLWAGTIPGGLFRSDDRGASWQLVDSLWNDPARPHWMGGGYDKPGIHSVLVDPRDSRTIAVAVSVGGVWESRDDGASWAVGGRGLIADYMPPDQASLPAAQDPHRMLRCQASPDRLWIQHHNGVFRADSGIDDWVRIHPSGGGFGFALAVHPIRPDTAWFVPAVKDEFRYPRDGKLLVARTTDGGASFDYLSEGLPQVHAYDLVYRHGLEVDASGECLAMGSTTGGLWFSDDGGDHWSAVEARLPPIYSVRFG